MMRTIQVSIAVVLACAHPLLASSQVGGCLNNLAQIDSAKEQHAIAAGLEDGATVDPSGISPYLKGDTVPVCPGSGAYTIGPLGMYPTCSIAFHSRAGLRKFLREYEIKRTLLSVAISLSCLGFPVALLAWFSRKRKIHHTAPLRMRTKILSVLGGYLIGGSLTSWLWYCALVQAPLWLRLLYAPFLPIWVTVRWM
jgi:hypothetical protein